MHPQAFGVHTIQRGWRQFTASGPGLKAIGLSYRGKICKHLRNLLVFGARIN